MKLQIKITLEDLAAEFKAAGLSASDYARLIDKILHLSPNPGEIIEKISNILESYREAEAEYAAWRAANINQKNNNNE